MIPPDRPRQPDTTPMTPATADLAPVVGNRLCDICSEQLAAGRIVRCRNCTEAAWQAIEEAQGRIVRPSGIRAIRDRQDAPPHDAATLNMK